MKLQAFAIAIFLAVMTDGSHALEVLISDAGNLSNPPWQIVKFDGNGENPQVLISEHLAWPQDLFILEAQGVLLVSNLSSDRINRHDLESGAFIDVFASNLSGPTRMKLGPDGLLYVLQWSGSGTVKRYQLDGTFVDDFTSTGVSQSIGLDWDDNGRLYVSSFESRSVRRFDANGNDLGLFIESGLNGPTNIEFIDNGDLLVLDWSGGAVRRYDSNGVLLGNFISGLTEPEGITRLPNGDFLIGDGGSTTVKRYDADGSFIEDFIPAGSGLLQPNAVLLHEPFSFNFGRHADGQWVTDDADRRGNRQGLTFDYLGFADALFLAWFTYVSSGDSVGDTGILDVGGADNRWLTGQMEIDGNVATGSLFASEGGIFDAPPNDAQETVEVGSISIKFSGCDQGTVDYEILDPPLAGTIRIIPLEKRLNPAFECQ